VGSAVVSFQRPRRHIRAIRLTNAAQALCCSNEQVVDVALDSGFDSHDGFTRAFTRQFDITPHEYQLETPAVNWFVHHPIEAYFALKEGTSPMPKDLIKRMMTVTAVERPTRRIRKNWCIDGAAGEESIKCTSSRYFPNEKFV